MGDFLLLTMCTIFFFFLEKPPHKTGCGNGSVKRNQQNKQFLLLYCCNYRLCMQAFLHLQIIFKTDLESHFKLELEVNIKYKARLFQVQCYFSISVLSSNASEELISTSGLKKFQVKCFESESFIYSTCYVEYECLEVPWAGVSEYI